MGTSGKRAPFLPRFFDQDPDSKRWLPMPSEARAKYEALDSSERVWISGRRVEPNVPIGCFIGYAKGLTTADIGRFAKDAPPNYDRVCCMEPGESGEPSKTHWCMSFQDPGVTWPPQNPLP